MLFITVGTELPFDRLVRVVDAWAGETGRSDVFAQIGDTRWRPAHIAWKHHLTPSEFARHLTEADVIIAHAGMGTILSALKAEKPILVMPRKASLREHRNEHQVATARRLAAMGKITVAADETELRAWLDRLGELRSHATVGPYASESLTRALAEFIRR